MFPFSSWPSVPRCQSSERASFYTLQPPPTRRVNLAVDMMLPVTPLPPPNPIPAPSALPPQPPRFCYLSRHTRTPVHPVWGQNRSVNECDSVTYKVCELLCCSVLRLFTILGENQNSRTLLEAECCHILSLYGEKNGYSSTTRVSTSTMGSHVMRVLLLVYWPHRHVEYCNGGTVKLTWYMQWAGLFLPRGA